MSAASVQASTASGAAASAQTSSAASSAHGTSTATSNPPSAAAGSSQASVTATSGRLSNTTSSSQQSLPASSAGAYSSSPVKPNFIPLTTVFTPPPYCSGLPLTLLYDNEGQSTFWRDPKPVKVNAGAASKSSCYPPHFTYQPDLYATRGGHIYSPAACPSGYYAGLSAQNGKGQPWTSWCCPQGMKFAVYEGCISTLTTTTVVTMGAGKHKSVTTPIAVLEPYIPVAWASSDLDSFSPKSAPLLSSACRLSLVATTSTSENGLNGSNGSSGLSTGEKAGIGSGAAAVGIIVVALITLFFLRRGKGKKDVMEMRVIGVPPR